MGRISIKELLERASKLDNDKLARLLNDLPTGAILKLANLALEEQMDKKNPELYQKIDNEAEKRFK